MGINVIGDVAGQYRTLVKLMDEMPDGEFILVGDLVDRGPDSRKVIELCMERDDVTVCYGNHEDLFINAVTSGRFSDRQLWIQNGGYSTAENYMVEERAIEVPAEQIEWLRSLPLWAERNGVIISHAPIVTDYNGLPVTEGRDLDFIWNRMPPKDLSGYLTIHGHNGQYQEFTDRQGEVFSYCIDNSHLGTLVGLHVGGDGMVTKYEVPLLD